MALNSAGIEDCGVSLDVESQVEMPSHKLEVLSFVLGFDQILTELDLITNSTIVTTPLTTLTNHSYTLNSTHLQPIVRFVCLVSAVRSIWQFPLSPLNVIQ
jgi:hypothetical protein